MDPLEWRYHDYIGLGITTTGHNTMKKNFLVQGGYYYDTLADALKEASRVAARTTAEIKVYQAVKLVSPKTPEVDVTDVVLA